MPLFDGLQKWPLDLSGGPDEDGAPSGGYGFMGSVPVPDPTQLGAPPDHDPATLLEQKQQGFAARFWAYPVSTWPLAAYFPDDGGDVRSFFRISPGNRVMAFDSTHFAGLMQETADTTFADTHYHDYQQHLSSEMATRTYRYP